MRRKDYKKSKSKVRRRLLKILLFLLLILGCLVGYIIFQYNEGRQAGESAVKSEKVKEPEDFNGAVVNELGKVNILLLGVDAREDDEPARTDTIMVAQYDPQANTAKLVSFMRDTYVEIPGYRNYKINTAYFLGGAELLRSTLKQNFDIDIHYYALVDFKGFEAAVDALAPDGVEIDVQKRMSEKIGVVIEPGLQQLNGKELLGYARFRADSEGDFGRVARQQEVLNAIKEEVLSVTGITKLPRVVGTVQPYIETNLGNTEVLGLMSDILLKKPDDIETLRIPVDESFYDASYSHAGSVLEIDFEQNQLAIQEFLGN
ncbi:LCP family protein [Bacillus suaedae]|uniref:Regulatory protein MsrR n=1 Tax=Halalkalibacter suaedae TaxID=2822140 RepID=A0A941AP34_9BACI|nr:LCP family protein [Bacillus suaedae]MBP3952330.1 LCP family protein [Bacillus suaedae]